ncbi:hypothetical protein ACFVWG_22165 [Kribbella sp. NPDC058245]
MGTYVESRLSAVQAGLSGADQVGEEAAGRGRVQLMGHVAGEGG